MPRAFIPSLFSRSRPAAICRLVIAVVVDAVNGVARRWPWSHIANKSIETATPFWAHPYAARTVITVLCAGWAFASVNSGSPHSVFGHCRSAVNGSHPSRLFCFSATATNDSPASKVIACDLGGLAAVAATQPCSTTVKTGHLVQNNQASVSLARNIYEWFSHRVYTDVFIVSRMTDYLAA